MFFPRVPTENPHGNPPVYTVFILFVPRVPTGNPHGNPHGIPWCTVGARGAPHGKQWNVLREPTVSRGMFFLSRGIPRIPAGSHGIPWDTAVPHGENAGIPVIVPTAAQGLGYLYSRKPTYFTEIIIPSNVSWGPTGSPGTHHGNSRRTPREISREFPRDPPVCHGVPWVLREVLGLPTVYRGFLWDVPRVPMGVHHGFLREFPGSYGKSHNNDNRWHPTTTSWLPLVLVSPVQPALLPGSSRIDGFHILIIGLPQGRDKEE